MRSLRRIAVAGGVIAASVALGIGVAGSANADGVLDQWYPTYGDCQYAGDVYAQQGIIYQFSCTPSDGGWDLIGT